MWLRRLVQLAIVAALPVPAFATAYTVTCSHLTMHAGDPAPPGIYQVVANSAPAVQVGAGSAIFTTPPSCSVGATAASPVGNYAITANKGTPASGNTATYVNGSIKVIAPDIMGAKITDVSYPPGWLSAPYLPAVDVTNNGIANIVGDCKTDNAVNLLKLLMFGRGTFTAKVNAAGTAVTAATGVSFLGLASGAKVTINGVVYTVSLVADATHLTLTTSAGTLTGSQNILAMPPSTFTSDGSSATITINSGPIATSYVVGRTLILPDQSVLKIAAIPDASHITLAKAPAAFTNGNMYASPSANYNWGPQLANFYFPPGCYGTSQQIDMYGTYWTFSGSGPQRSYFYLLPNSPEFNVPGSTRAVQFFNPQSNGGNANNGEFMNGIGFRVGAGNANAAIFTTESNNLGSFRDMQFWNDDSNCKYAMNFARAYPGPHLFKNLAVYGCQRAAFSNQGEYISIFDGLTIEGQTAKGFDLNGYKVAVENMLSDDAVPVMTTSAVGQGNFTVVDGEWFNNSASPSEPAAVLGSGSFAYLKNIAVKGYPVTIADLGTGKLVNTSGSITQYWTGVPTSLFDNSPDSLHLPQDETPLPNDPAKNTWTQLSADSGKWNAQINGSASATLYLPPGSYSIPANVTLDIPSKVSHIDFNNSTRQPVQAGMVTINTGGLAKDPPLIIEGCIVQRCLINQTGPRTVVLIDNQVSDYVASPGAGNLYLEDFLTGGPHLTPIVFVAGQNVWGRHVNLESKNREKIDCNGANVWILGYKTEQNSPIAFLTAGCKMEVFGGFYYMNAPAMNATDPFFKVTDSSLFFAGFTQVDQPGKGMPNWVTETRGGVTTPLPNSTINSSNHLSVFYSFGAHPSSTPKTSSGAAKKD